MVDPKVVYDPYGERWIVAAQAETQTTKASALVGVSQTSDPTAGWNLYLIDADPANLVSVDFTALGFNRDWIVVSYNLENAASGAHLGVRFYVFNKTNLYAGGAGLFTRFDRADLGYTQYPATTYDAFATNLYVVGQWNCDPGSTNCSQLRIFTISGPVGSETFTYGPIISSTNRWNYNAVSFFSVVGPQLGSTQKIEIIGAEILSLVCRNGSLWTAHGVALPAGAVTRRTSIQWWQLSPAGGVIQRGLIDDPAGKTFYGYFKSVGEQG